MKVRLADYIANFLVEHGILNCFTVTGGGAMHLNDAFGHKNGLSCIYNHNEQACTIAAEGYYRTSGKIALACVTSGPGGTNAITGVLGAWLDSIPMIVISGQVKYETTVRSTGIIGLRQLGDQEFDITSCVSTMTKYSVMVVTPHTIRYHLEKALYLACCGRPGPVWLDIPLDVQASLIDTDDLKTFCFDEEFPSHQLTISDEIITEVLNKLRVSKRPLFYVGLGIHLSHSEEKLIQLADMWGIPVVCGFSAHDIFYYDHPLYVGRPGTIGDRAGNFAVQNSDLLIILGCRLNIRQIGYNFENFAPFAFKIMVDIDDAELRKPTLSIDLPVNGNVSEFIDQLQKRYDDCAPDYSEWVAWCMERKRAYPVCLPEYYTGSSLINPYCFMDALGQKIPENLVMVASNASACICSFQAIHLKKGQRLFSNSGSAPMGYGLPAAIGAAVASFGNKVICFEGDGSIQMNIQELATVSANKLPIIIFVMNNRGYHSIRQTQTNFFGGKLVGCNAGDGIMFPNLQQIAKAYNMSYVCCKNHSDIMDCISLIMKISLPVICEVMLTPDQPFAPRSASRKLDNGCMVSRPLDDMAPFLPRDEYFDNLLEPLKKLRLSDC